MDLEVERVDVWAATIQDETGALASLLKGLQKVGADLQFIIARRSPDRPGKGVVFVTPLLEEQERIAASRLGFNVTQSLQSIRVRGLDRAGYFHKVVDCQWACPAHTPVPEYIRLIAAGRYTTPT
jgi:hypothetical protein